MMLLRILTLILFPLLISSCVVIPLQIKPPFPKELLVRLDANNADKRLVKKLFGNPKVTRKQGEYWFYAVTREVAGILGGAGSAVIEDSEWLAIQFDKSGNVKFYEFNDDRHGCLSNGICHRKRLFSEHPKDVVITAPSLEDERAKNYDVKDNECAIYLFQHPVFHIRAGNYPVSLTIDHIKIGAINYETYLFVTRWPGEVNIKAYQFDVTVNCVAGEKIYLQVDEGWTAEEGKDFTQVTSTVGAEEIFKRRLALPD